ncbi:hypothetical protein MKW92_048658 [Papaver armeniacum]|nr:hypothetical protein MKW92_048658 [Papaver armeniacum]
MEESTVTGLLKQSAGKFPSHRSVSVSGKFDLTHSKLQQLVDQAASILISNGVHPGDVIALTFPNTVELEPRLHPLNSAYTQKSLNFICVTQNQNLLTSQEGNQSAQSAASKLSISHITATFSHLDEKLTLSTQSESGALPDSLPVNDPLDIALFLHTSGTTSQPKGVPLTQQNLAASVQNIISVYKLTESDSTVLVLPLFHVHGLLAGLLSSLGAGAAVTLPAAGRFSASTFWPDMIKYNATWYTAVPTIHQIILERHLSHLRILSEAPVYSELGFGAPVLEAYAMTEASHLMCSNPLPVNGGHKSGSVGKPVGQEMAILDENGVQQAENVSGEVCIRGLNVTKGYKNNPEANKSAYKFGWFHTGDVGYMDSEGICICAFVESDVAQAVAFGVPDDKYGEEINCAIIPRDRSTIDEAEILRFCKKNLATFKVPKKVFITDAVPKTASGKIQRNLVAEHFLSQISAAKVPKFGA